MANERLSKLQKWILETCFKITVQHNRKGLKPLKICICYDENECTGSVIKGRGCYNDIEYHCNRKNMRTYKSVCDMYNMYTEDILLNYFDMEYSNARGILYRAARIKMDGNTDKNYASISRSLKNMEDKNLIYRWKYAEYSTRIYLTDKGKERAMQILNILYADIYEPPLLTEKECNKKREALKNILKKYGLDSP